MVLHDGLQGVNALDPVDPFDPAASEDLHEEAHARADQAAAEGRLAQQGRQELSRAVLTMAQVAAYLERSDLAPARAAGQVALEHLQRAFSSSRYILRAMTEREQLDDGRRLSGSTAEAVPDRRPGVLPGADPEVVELRAVLAAITPAAAANDGGLLARSAARVLAVRPADPDHFAIAASLRAAADGVEGDGPRAPCPRPRRRRYRGTGGASTGPTDSCASGSAIAGTSATGSRGVARIRGLMTDLLTVAVGVAAQPERVVQ